MTAKVDTKKKRAEQPATTDNVAPEPTGTESAATAAPPPSNPQAAPSDYQKIDLLLDVEMKLTVELGRTRVKIRDLMNLAPGAVVELSRLTSEPVDILVNDALLATGEVVVVDDHFAVRVTKLLDRVERLKRVV